MGAASEVISGNDSLGALPSSRCMRCSTYLGDNPLKFALTIVSFALLARRALNLYEFLSLRRRGQPGQD